MQSGAVRNRLAHTMVAGLFWLAVGGATEARASLSDSICGAMAAVKTQDFPSSADLSRVAASTETQLARRGLSGAYQDMLPALDMAAANADRPSPAAVAEYCAAAGELMRISPQGSQLQAQSYLLNAFRLARGSGLQCPPSAPVRQIEGSR